MAQISLYIEDSIAEKLAVTAKELNCSISKFVATIINERLSDEDAEEKRKKKILKKLRGAITDPTFAEPPDIPWEAESHRIIDLL